MKVFIDFETAYTDKMNLTKLNYSDYIRQTEVMLCTTMVNGELRTFKKGEALNINHDDTLIAHNIMFDAAVLKEHYGITCKRYECTLSAARLLYPSSDHSLKALIAKFFPGKEQKDTEALLKTKNKRWDDLTDTEQKEFIAYNQADVRLLSNLYYKLYPKIPFFERKIINHTTQLWLNPTILLDKKLAIKTLETERTAMEMRIKQSGLTKTTIRSDAKFSNHLHQIGKKPPTKYSDKKKAMVPAFAKDDPAFKQFYIENPDLHDLLDLKRDINSSIKESRTERLIQLANPTLAIFYTYAGAFTGRFSGGNKVNLQNLPRNGELRNCLVAPPGKHLVVVDLAQIEARVLAWMANETSILNVFKAKGDLYSTVAEQIYKIPVTKKTHPKERQIGKSAALGLGYGMGAERFSEYCAAQGQKLSIAECTNIVNVYRTTFTRITSLWSDAAFAIHQLISTDAYDTTTLPYITITPNKVILPSGRALHYEGLKCPNERSGFYYGNLKRLYGPHLIENIVQAISRDILCYHILETEKAGYKVIMHTHDELVVCVPEADTPKALEDILTIMRTAPKWAPELPLDAEGAHHPIYGHCK